MFSAISRIVAGLLGTVLDHEDPSEDNKSNAESSYNYYCTRSAGIEVGDSVFRDQDQHDVLLTAIVDDQDKNSESSAALFTGKVTQVFCGHGLIDGEVYFSADSVYQGGILQVGDLVSVVARQQHNNGGWVAETVTLVKSSWEEEPETAVVSTGEVGKVTWFRDKEGIINKNICFSISNCLEGYMPHAGDWVTVELEEEENLEENNKNNKCEDSFEDILVEKQFFATGVAPLREWSFQGVVSAALSDHGYIDGEVYFRLDACLNGYRPRKWDRVKVAAIESTQGKCSWRAVAVFPLSSDSSSYRSMQNKNQPGRGRGWVVPGLRPLMYKYFSVVF